MSIPIIKPLFTIETALAKVKAAENAWNTRNPEMVGSPTRRIPNGATATSFLIDAKRSKSFYALNGRRNVTIV